jgi:uncharacterized protein (TIGR02996 family)
MALDPKLLARVVARPKDDAPRLVLADKLTEAGDPRGEFIVCQCLLMDPHLPPARRLELRTRSAALLTAHGKTWGASAAGLRKHVFRRGFLDEIDAYVDSLLPVAANLFATEPVTKLTVWRADEDGLLALANAGAFARVTTLTIRGTIGDGGAKVLASALGRRDTPLESLNVGGCGIEHEGASTLAAVLSGCRSLALTGNEILDAGLTSLAGSKALGQLQALYVTANGLSDEGVGALADAGLPSLARLSIARNDDVTSDGVRALAKSKKLKKLRWLEYTDPEDGNQCIAVRGGRA